MNVHVRLFLSTLLLALSLVVGHIVARHGGQEVRAAKSLPPVEFYGPIKELPPGRLGRWIVGTTPVVVTSKTHVDSTRASIAINRWARVRGSYQDDRLYADSIVALPEQSVPRTVDMHGIVQKVMGQIWMVSGHQVRISPTTSIEGSVPPHAGVVASVEGYLDGNIVVARRITLRRPEDEERDVEFLGRLERVDGTTWIVNGLEVHVQPHVKPPPIGSLVGIQGHLSGTRVLANKVVQDVAPRVSLDGWLIETQPNQHEWHVLVHKADAARTVRVRLASDTPVDERMGLVQPGAQVEVLGHEITQDVIQATFARVLKPRHAYVTGTLIYIPEDRFAYPWTVFKQTSSESRADKSEEIQIRIRPTTVSDRPFTEFYVGERVAISGIPQEDGTIEVLMISHSKR